MSTFVTVVIVLAAVGGLGYFLYSQYKKGNLN